MNSTIAEKINVKSELMKIIDPIFGKEAKQLIDSAYDENDSEEMLKVVKEMLVDYLGEIRAKIILTNLMERLNKHGAVKIS